MSRCSDLDEALEFTPIISSDSCERFMKAYYDSLKYYIPLLAVDARVDHPRRNSDIYDTELMQDKVLAGIAKMYGLAMDADTSKVIFPEGAARVTYNEQFTQNHEFPSDSCLSAFRDMHYNAYKLATTGKIGYTLKLDYTVSNDISGDAIKETATDTDFTIYPPLVDEGFGLETSYVEAYKPSELTVDLPCGKWDSLSSLQRDGTPADIDLFGVNACSISAMVFTEDSQNAELGQNMDYVCPLVVDINSMGTKFGVRPTKNNYNLLYTGVRVNSSQANGYPYLRYNPYTYKDLLAPVRDKMDNVNGDWFKVGACLHEEVGPNAVYPDDADYNCFWWEKPGRDSDGEVPFGLRQNVGWRLGWGHYLTTCIWWYYLNKMNNGGSDISRWAKVPMNHLIPHACVSYEQLYKCTYYLSTDAEGIGWTKQSIELIKHRGKNGTSFNRNGWLYLQNAAVQAREVNAIQPDSIGDISKDFSAWKSYVPQDASIIQLSVANTEDMDGNKTTHNVVEIYYCPYQVDGVTTVTDEDLEAIKKLYPESQKQKKRDAKKELEDQIDDLEDQISVLNEEYDDALDMFNEAKAEQQEKTDAALSALEEAQQDLEDARQTEVIDAQSEYCRLSAEYNTLSCALSAAEHDVYAANWAVKSSDSDHAGYIFWEKTGTKASTQSSQQTWCEKNGYTYVSTEPYLISSYNNGKNARVTWKLTYLDANGNTQTSTGWTTYMYYTQSGMSWYQYYWLLGDDATKYKDMSVNDAAELLTQYKKTLSTAQTAMDNFYNSADYQRYLELDAYTEEERANITEASSEEWLASDEYKNLKAIVDEKQEDYDYENNELQKYLSEACETSSDPYYACQQILNQIDDLNLQIEDLEEQIDALDANDYEVDSANGALAGNTVWVQTNTNDDKSLSIDFLAVTGYQANFIKPVTAIGSKVTRDAMINAIDPAYKKIGDKYLSASIKPGMCEPDFEWPSLGLKGQTDKETMYSMKDYTFYKDDASTRYSEGFETNTDCQSGLFNDFWDDANTISGGMIQNDYHGIINAAVTYYNDAMSYYSTHGKFDKMYGNDNASYVKAEATIRTTDSSGGDSYSIPTGGLSVYSSLVLTADVVADRCLSGLTVKYSPDLSICFAVAATATGIPTWINMTLALTEDVYGEFKDSTTDRYLFDPTTYYPYLKTVDGECTYDWDVSGSKGEENFGDDSVLKYIRPIVMKNIWVYVAGKQYYEEPIGYSSFLQKASLAFFQYNIDEGDEDDDTDVLTGSGGIGCGMPAWYRTEKGGDKTLIECWADAQAYATNVLSNDEAVNPWKTYFMQNVVCDSLAQTVNNHNWSLYTDATQFMFGYGIDAYPDSRVCSADNANPYIFNGGVSYSQLTAAAVAKYGSLTADEMATTGVDYPLTCFTRQYSSFGTNSYQKFWIQATTTSNTSSAHHEDTCLKFYYDNKTGKYSFGFKVKSKSMGLNAGYQYSNDWLAYYEPIDKKLFVVEPKNATGQSISFKAGDGSLAGEYMQIRKEMQDRFNDNIDGTEFVDWKDLPDSPCGTYTSNLSIITTDFPSLTCYSKQQDEDAEDKEELHVIVYKYNTDAEDEDSRWTQYESWGAEILDCYYNGAFSFTNIEYAQKKGGTVNARTNWIYENKADRPAFSVPKISAENLPFNDCKTYVLQIHPEMFRYAKYTT